MTFVCETPGRPSEELLEDEDSHSVHTVATSFSNADERCALAQLMLSQHC
jgi:hypothetical protein